MRAFALAVAAASIAACSIGALDGFSGDPTADAGTAADATTNPANDAAPVDDGGPSETDGATTSSKYHATVAADSPIAHFTFEESSGGGCASSVPTSMVCTYPPDDVMRAQPGVGGTKSVRLNAATATLNLSGMPSDLGAPYTVELWLRLDAAVASTGLGVYMESAADGRNGFNLFLWDNALIRTEVWKADSLIAYGVAASPLSSSVWHHLVITHSSGPPDDDTFYVDGANVESENTQPAAGRPIVSSTFKLYGFVGYVDEIAIYDKALAAGRIAAHYAAQ